MTPKQIFKQTMPFCWLKLGLGMASFAINVVLFAILVGIGALISPTVMLVMIFIWLALTGVVSFVFKHYLTYMAKAGHIAVISLAVTTGQMPTNVIETGKNMVQERFATANIYFLVDKLVNRAVKQLQNLLASVGNIFRSIPFVGMIVSFGQLFIGISLGYIDECCLGYTFYRKDEGAFKSAADGVVIYAQNIKTLLKSGLSTAAIVLGLQLAVMVVPFLLFSLLLGLFMDVTFAAIIAFILAAMMAAPIRTAFIDSWVLTKMMTVYMQLAPTTAITYDLYGKLSNLSRDFRKLFEKGREESPQPAYAMAGGAPAPAAYNAYQPVQQPITQVPQQVAPPTQQPAAAWQNTQPQYQYLVQQPPMQAQQPMAAYPAPVQAPSAAQTYCGHCGTPLAAGTQACPRCGAVIAQ